MDEAPDRCWRRGASHSVREHQDMWAQVDDDDMVELETKSWSNLSTVSIKAQAQPRRHCRGTVGDIRQNTAASKLT